MPSVDDRIVRMEFDNAAFERKIQGTLASLAQLDKALELKNAANGFTGISAAANNVNLSGMASSIDNISSKFGALGAVGFSVIQSLTQGVLGFVGKFSGDILSPIFSGGFERAKAIQQAQFMFEGLGIDVTAAMDSARTAVLGTAYGLGEAAKAAAQFAASGIPVGDKMTGALRGVAGAAAMTGAAFNDIAYIYSGIAGQNKVNSQDLMQFSTRGLNVAAGIAKTMGISEQAVRDMVSNGELDFATFSDAMDKAYGEHATAANETFVGSLANMEAALSRLGAAVISPQMNNFRDIFNALTPTIDSFTAAIKPAIDMVTFLAGVVKNNLVGAIGGISFDNLKMAMPAITEGMANIFKALSNIWNIGKQAFAQIFPPGTEPLILKIAEAFKNFSEHLQVTVDGMTRIRSIFEGVFSVLSIGWTIVKEGAKFLFDLGKSLLGIFGPGVVGGLTKFADFFTGLQDSLVKGGGIKSFFEGLTKSIQKPLEALEKIKNAVSDFFSGFTSASADAVGSTVDSLGNRFDNFKNRLSDVWGPFKSSLEKIGGILEKVGGEIGQWFSDLAKKLTDAISTGEFNNVLDALNVTLLGGIAAMIGKFLKGGINFTLGAGWLNIGGTFQQLTGTLNAMQTKLKSEALLKIGEAIALLTASVVVLSMIDSAALTKALSAMAVGFGELLGAFVVIDKMSLGVSGGLNFGVVATGLVILAGAMVILALAMKLLSGLDWEGIGKGLTGVSVGLGLLIGAVNLMPDDVAMISAGAGIMGIASGLLIMAIAMKIMATMSWEELSKGLIGVAVGLAAMVGAMNLMPDDLAMIKAGISIMAIAAAMVILGAAVKIFASMDWESMGKGLLGLAISLGAIVLALNLMPKDMGKSAAAILGVGAAILVIATAIKLLGGMSWESIAKGLVAITVSLGLLVGASLLMEGAIPGAGAMVLVAGSLVILTKAISTIGKMSWGDLIKGLVGIALGIGIIAGASLLLTPAVPEIIALGLGLLVLGAGLALVGAGAYLTAKAVEILFNALIKSAESLPQIVEALGQLIPTFIKGVAEGVVQMIEVFTKAAPVIAKGLGVLLDHILDTLIKVLPKIFDLIDKTFAEMIKLGEKYTDPLIALGIHIILSFLQGIRDNIGKIVDIVADIITNFLDAMTNKIPEVVDSLVATITTMFTETARGLGEISGTLMLGVGIAFMGGFFNGIINSIGPIATWFGNLASTVFGWIGDTLTTLGTKGSDLISGLLNGIVSFIGNVWTFFTNLPGQVIGFFVNAINWLVNAGVDIIGGLASGLGSRFGSIMSWLGGLPGTIIDFFSGAYNWLINAGQNIIQGLMDGLSDIWNNHVVPWVEEKVKGLIHSLTHPWELLSPSHLMRRVGVGIMQGWYLGLQDGYKAVDDFISNINPVDSFMNGPAAKLSKAVGDVANSLNDMPEFQPTITPVLDLTRVAADAGKIGDYMKVTDPFSPTASFSNAQTIAAAQRASQQTDLKPDTSSPTQVTFEQTINAPTALSASDIYKQTRNQITIAKEELSIP